MPLVSLPYGKQDEVQHHVSYFASVNRISHFSKRWFFFLHKLMWITKYMVFGVNVSSILFVCFYHFWQISHGIGLNILAFIPTVILGIMGGLLGAVFTFLNLKVLHLKVSPINNYCVRFLWYPEQSRLRKGL